MIDSIATQITALRDEGLARAALKLDAVVTGANGAAYVAAAELLDGPLGLPASFLRPVGAFLIVFAACVWFASTRAQVDRSALSFVALLNALWVVDSIALLALGWYDPTTGGAVWIGLQAMVVGAFAALQAYAARNVV